MATERFYFWRAYYDTLGMLSDEEAGVLVKAMCAYAFDGEEPDFTGHRDASLLWTITRDQIAESVALGKRQSEYGKQGGRPPKDADKRVPKRVPKSTPKRGPKRVPESEEKGIGRETPPSKDGGGGASLRAADAAQLAPTTRPNGMVIPPRPEGWE